MRYQKKLRYQKKFGTFYNSKRWRELRAYKFATNPLCEECLKKGKIVQAVDIHHIHPIDTAYGWEHRYDIDNLESLCIECHNGKHESRQSSMTKFDKMWEELQLKGGNKND